MNRIPKDKTQKTNKEVNFHTNFPVHILFVKSAAATARVPQFTDDGGLSQWSGLLWRA
jgi:hypothetical protein